MKKFIKYLGVAVCGVSLASCSLSTTSPSSVDGSFVFSGYETAKTVLLGAYNQYLNDYNNGYIPNFTSIGSDIERCSVGNITDLVGGAQLYLEPYTEDAFNINFQKGNWDRFYSIINKCNNTIQYIEERSDINDIIATAPNDFSDLLGQAYALRASVYYDMAMFYGDVPYVTVSGQVGDKLDSRDMIIESELENLYRVEPYLYKLGESGHYSDQMTRNFVDGLIGRMCFMAAGYQTRRTDLGNDFYVDKDGKVITFEKWSQDESNGAFYARRSDWKKFYEAALPYLKKAVEDPGEAALTTVDPRSDSQGRTYDNPFQYYFQQVNEQQKATETIYELTMKEVGGGSRIAYNFGRGSAGGSPACPPKANAQVCSYPEVYYGEFDPQDKRRDASMTVTGSSGTGVEQLYNYALGNRNTGGIGLNKYDPNRVATPDLRQLYSGISFIHMRQADIILMLAEAYAQTGDEGSAREQLKKVHDRAFDPAVRDAKFAELLATPASETQSSLVEAILKERQLEFQGENLRRWDLVRSGNLPKIAYEYRKKLVDHMAELRANGYVNYPNGNQLPAYVWTKLVNAKADYGYRLTMTTPAGLTEASDRDKYAVLYPGWRGQHDDWEAARQYQISSGRSSKVNVKVEEDKTNLAIVGLFRYIAPGSAEAQALEADGYVQTPWASGMYISTKTGAYDANIEAEWSSKFMGGYTDADYAAKKAPIYLIPMENTVCKTTGFKNGYGFPSERS